MLTGSTRLRTPFVRRRVPRRRELWNSNLVSRSHRAGNWASLWNPAIDSLGGIFGVDDPNWPFQTRDERSTRLGLHRTINEKLAQRDDRHAAPAAAVLEREKRFRRVNATCGFSSARSTATARR